MVYNILDYGAISDGMTVNTASIQRAIDECAVTGGRVLVPAGRFVTGSLELKSNMDFHLEKGAVLLASENLSDYNELDAYPQNWGCKKEGWDGKHLIRCVEQENVSITGMGIIDGAGQFFFDERAYTRPGYGWRHGLAQQKPCFEARPGQMIVFCECHNVKVYDVHLRNSCSWTLYLHGCEWVQVNGITVKNEEFHQNTDGIDVDACRYVTISDCIIDTGDDAIAIRCSGLQRLRGNHDVCEHVTVNNCVLSSLSSCFRIGVGTGTIRHINVSNVTIKTSGVAITFNPEWGTSSTPTYNVRFNNITATDTGEFLGLASNNTRVSEISISNVYTECDSAVVIKSTSEENVYNVSLKDIFVKKIDIVVQNREKLVDIGAVGNLTFDNVRTDNGLLKY